MGSKDKKFGVLKVQRKEELALSPQSKKRAVKAAAKQTEKDQKVEQMASLQFRGNLEDGEPLSKVP